MALPPPDGRLDGPGRMHVDPEDPMVLADLAAETVRRINGPASLGSTRTLADLSGLAGPTISADGMGPQEALRIWTDVLAPACIAVDHPRYLAFIPTAPTHLSMAFDMLVGASGICGNSWLEGAGAVYAENQTLRWIADLAGFPESAGGTFVQGGTAGNLSALVAAREHAKWTRPAPTGRWAVCITTETHSSVAHSLESVMDVDVVIVPGDPRGRMTAAALRRTADALPPERRSAIFAVVATAGSTNLGMIDDLAGIANLATENGWWLHVDAAYGGAGLAAPSIRHRYTGIERADSFIVDPHKWLFSPLDCCALVYRDPLIAQRAHTQHADYLDVLGEDGWNPSDYAVQLSRRTRGLPLWYSLASHGTDAYRDAVEETLRVTNAGANLVRHADHLDLLFEPETGVLVFTRRGWRSADYQAWSHRLLEDRIAFVTPTRHHGQPCARVAVVNPTTTVADLETVFDSMR